MIHHTKKLEWSYDLREDIYHKKQQLVNLNPKQDGHKAQNSNEKLPITMTKSS